MSTSLAVTLYTHRWLPLQGMLTHKLDWNFVTSVVLNDMFDTLSTQVKTSVWLFLLSHLVQYSVRLFLLSHLVQYSVRSVLWSVVGEEWEGHELHVTVEEVNPHQGPRHHKISAGCFATTPGPTAREDLIKSHRESLPYWCRCTVLYQKACGNIYFCTLPTRPSLTYWYTNNIYHIIIQTIDTT
jgi:hypothetical protein